MAEPLIFLVLLCVEGSLLYAGQRHLFGTLDAGRLPRPLVYLWAMPGTVLHELAHALACLCLGVALGRIELFRPRRHPDGGVTLGQVEHAHADPLRLALVAIAPFIFVPVLLIGLACLLFGNGVLSDPLGVFLDGAIWKQALFAYVLISSGAAAFPSPGDHIPPLGFVMLILILIGLAGALGPERLGGLLRIAVLIAAPAALAAALQLALLRRRV